MTNSFSQQAHPANVYRPNSYNRYMTKSVDADGNVSWVPATSLDQVFAFKARLGGEKIQINFIDLISGEVLTPENSRKFYREMIKQREMGIYLTTDHLICWVRFREIDWIYVSLDNSVRANMNGHALKNERLDSMCELVSNAIKTVGGSAIVIFSEACRPSFDGGMGEMRDKVPWIQIREQLKKRIGLKHIFDCANNQDDMAFGLSAFCTPDLIDRIQEYYGVSILEEGFGSVVLGIKIDGYIGGGIHFPLDFRGKGAENQGAKAMVNLQAVMHKYEDWMFVFGDFNTIPGFIEDAILAAIDAESFEFLVKEFGPTFFGAHYDRIPSNVQPCPELCLVEELEIEID